MYGAPTRIVGGIQILKTARPRSSSVAWCTRRTLSSRMRRCCRQHDYASTWKELRRVAVGLMIDPSGSSIQCGNTPRVTTSFQQFTMPGMGCRDALVMRGGTAARIHHHPRPSPSQRGRRECDRAQVVCITPRSFCIAGRIPGTCQPLSEIAYAASVADYAHCVRRFRRWFGHSAGSRSKKPVRTRP